MQLSSTRQFVPDYYLGSTDMDAVVQELDALFGVQAEGLTSLWNDQWVQTADEAGITAFERIFGIRASAGEDLEFRRERLLNRFSLTPPFTLPFLKERLDAIVGPGMWSAYVDYATRTLYIETSSLNQNWYQELQITLVKLKPANMVYVNTPLLTHTINVSEEIRFGQKHFNYRLGQWELGILPFAQDTVWEVAKLPSTPSIQDRLLAHNAAFTATDITSVRLNGTEVISTFETKTSEDEDTILEYLVPISSGNAVTLVELLDSNGNVLSSATCYVPREETVLFKHIIRFKEGE